MNLAETISSSTTPVHMTEIIYNNIVFSSLQVMFYNEFLDAILHKENLIVDTPYRCIGKSKVLEKLSADLGLFVFKNGRINHYTKIGNEGTLRGSRFYGIRTEAILIDEPTTSRHLIESGALLHPCIGFGYHDQIAHSREGDIRRDRIESKLHECYKKGAITLI